MQHLIDCAPLAGGIWTFYEGVTTTVRDPCVLNSPGFLYSYYLTNTGKTFLFSEYHMSYTGTVGGTCSESTAQSTKLSLSGYSYTAAGTMTRAGILTLIDSEVLVAGIYASTCAEWDAWTSNTATFESPTCVMGANPLSDYITIYGYDDATVGSEYFRVENVKGTSWGNNGRSKVGNPASGTIFD